MTSGETGLLKDLANKILYLGNFDGCEKITDMYRVRASKEETSALNTVAKALKAVPIRAVRDFQRVTTINRHIVLLLVIAQSQESRDKKGRFKRGLIVLLKMITCISKTLAPVIKEVEIKEDQPLTCLKKENSLHLEEVMSIILMSYSSQPQLM